MQTGAKNSLFASVGTQICDKINKKASDRLVVAPTFNTRGGGIYLSWRF